MANKVSKNAKKGIVGTIVAGLATLIVKVLEQKIGDIPAEQEAMIIGTVVFAVTAAMDAIKHRDKK